MNRVFRDILIGARQLIIRFIVSPIFAICLFCPYTTYAAINEQMAVDPVSVALSNTVTARPPGIAAVHFNPAGLKNLPDGKVKYQGFAAAFLRKKFWVSEDPDFEGFMNSFGPGRIGQNGEDDSDPWNGSSDVNTSTNIHLPLIGTLTWLALPTSGNAYRKPGSKWTFARGVVLPFSSALSYSLHPLQNPSRFAFRRVHLQRLNYLSPGVSYQVNDTLSVGVTVAAGMTLMGLDKANRSPSHMTALTKILGRATENLNIPVISQETLPPPWFGGGISPWEDAAQLELELYDYFSPSYNIGILWEPKKWFAFGAVYQSPIRNELHGRFVLKYENCFRRLVDWNGSSPLLRTNAAILDLPTTSVPYQKGNIKMDDWSWPQRVQAGIMLRPIKKLRLLVDLHWTDWASIHEYHFRFDQDIQAFEVGKMSGHTHGDRATAIDLGYENEFHFSYGLEYDLSKTFTFRCGYEDRQSSQKLEYFSASSLPDMEKYGIGFGINLKNGAVFNFGYGYGTTERMIIPNDTSINLNSLKFTKASSSQYAGSDVASEVQVHVFQLGMTKPVGLPEETAVRKVEKFKSLKRNLKHLKEKLKSLNPFRKK